jgi:hypothetical protein
MWDNTSLPFIFSIPYISLLNLTAQQCQSVQAVSKKTSSPTLSMNPGLEYSSTSATFSETVLKIEHQRTSAVRVVYETVLGNKPGVLSSGRRIYRGHVMIP